MNHYKQSDYVEDLSLEPIGDIDEDDTLYSITAYPESTIGFIIGVGNNLEELLLWAINQAENY